MKNTKEIDNETLNKALTLISQVNELITDGVNPDRFFGDLELLNETVWALTDVQNKLESLEQTIEGNTETFFKNKLFELNRLTKETKGIHSTIEEEFCSYKVVTLNRENEVYEESFNHDDIESAYFQAESIALTLGAVTASELNDY